MITLFPTPDVPLRPRTRLQDSPQTYEHTKSTVTPPQKPPTIPVALNFLPALHHSFTSNSDPYRSYQDRPMSNLVNLYFL
ncbi:hypothetical protein FVEG_05320 [Fusarium verticillioides 7600]|uniref:Uncharacterized protein n=1 Tax=Gibberella moniliformis (strain M3125 / FGSC 7600) TaxID=334819 RepID=W7LXZ7_GIBM7|nr:hypothetical protein FVEG_05320 [Fusarium verticillioides 7600]EWG44158.1 hypothetical protein FVEG_05320 [Fusarium verticillioides 7600]